MTRQETTRAGMTARRAIRYRDDRLLRPAVVIFLAGFLLHNSDHARRGLAVVSPEVIWLGTAGAILSLAAIAIVFFGHRLAPIAAVAVGFSMAAGVVAVHLLPHWSAFSDPLPGGNVDVWSWLAVLAEVGGALVLGMAGAYVLRRDHAQSSFHPPSPPKPL